MSIIKHVTLQKIVAHDFRYDPRRNVLRFLRMSFSVVNGPSSVCALSTKLCTLSDEQNGPPTDALLAGMSNNK